MDDARESAQCAAETVCDALKYVGDISYAILPRDVAHGLGDLKKAVLNSFRSFIDWEVEWIDDRVAGGDRLREEWQEKCRADAAAEPSSPAN